MDHQRKGMQSMQYASNPIERAFVKHYVGPLASDRVCTICGHKESFSCGRGTGRGHGMREGNKARGRIIQHVKAAHPGEVAGLGGIPTRI
jgi:hypothetical protein